MEIKSELMDRRLFSRNLRIVSSTKNYSPQLKKPQNVEAEKNSENYSPAKLFRIRVMVPAMEEQNWKQKNRN